MMKEGTDVGSGCRFTVNQRKDGAMGIEGIVHEGESHPGEMELRNAETPWPETAEELADLTAKLLDRPHDYGSAPAALAKALAAAFNYHACRLGMSGAQAGFAGIELIRRVRRVKGPVFLLDLNDALYPQCDPVGRVREAVEDNRQWLADEAKKLIAESRGERHVHPDVRAHWEHLAAYEAPKE
jgi:hypothetical protein